MTYLIVLGVLCVTFIVMISNISPPFKAFLLLGLGLWLMSGVPEAKACEDAVIVEECDPGFTCSDEPEPEIVVLVDIFEEIE